MVARKTVSKPAEMLVEAPVVAAQPVAQFSQPAVVDEIVCCYCGRVINENDERIESTPVTFTRSGRMEWGVAVRATDREQGDASYCCPEHAVRHFEQVLKSL